MSIKPVDKITSAWVEGDLCLVGSLDSRMIGLLKAIEQSGSINQAAKQVGLSYKGAWQIIERANNLAPKVLITTATGGAKGGGTYLTTAGQSLLQLFTRIDEQHKQFLQKINEELADDPLSRILLKRLVIKTSATNQLFGTIIEIEHGAVNAEVVVNLKGGEQVAAAISLSELKQLELTVGADIVLLINGPEIIITTDPESYRFSARNCLRGKVVRLQVDGVDAEVVIHFPSGDSLVAIISQASAEAMGLELGISAHALFKSNAVMIGII
ncbi:MAG: LysR family transcriptional regulator [Methylococcales bacterium]|nr:MAG: LysR family transcriptional regulator [Methylococcales bacterium]